VKEKVVYMLAFGILTLLGFIIIGDFIVALKENRPVDDSIVNLLQLTITGLVGIIGTYFGAKNNNQTQ
tara:strand:+ start:3254 stop:3457 length:204 start_codon:yes stop_codon:yes gene_type:complete